MNSLSKRLKLVLIISLVSLVAGNSQFLAASPTLAQEGVSPENDLPAPLERPFQLPFAKPAGPDTWLMAQPYGNTTGAYRRRFSTYGASGGIHFGLDLSAPCGTEIVAIADGIVYALDGPYGSPPHNLMIDHPQLGYASMYGHLLRAPDLLPGQQVKQGEVIALTGDSGETCYGRPHLHLEIRDLDHVRKYNPQLLIEANWDSLALYGSDGRDFARDLTEPRKWQTLYDQPEVQTGGPIVNDFDYPWPFDWEKGRAIPAVPAAIGVAASLETAAAATSLRTSPVGRQIIAGDCCTQPYWSQDSSEVRFIDQPGLNEPVGVWGVDVNQPESGPRLVTERLGYYSPDRRLVAYPGAINGGTIIERIADGQTWTVETRGRGVSFSPDSRYVIWFVYDEDAPSDTREETIWLAKTDGSQARAVFSARRTDPVAWLSSDELLMSRRLSGTSNEQLFTLSLADGNQKVLTETPRTRGERLSPDRRYLVFYISREPEAGENGVWLLDLQQPEQGPQKLPFFGAYRWRDNQRLIYVPFAPDATQHDFFEYDLVSGRLRPLFREGTNLTIANNDWQVSPDGRKIALVAADGTALDGLWVLEIPR